MNKFLPLDLQFFSEDPPPVVDPPTEPAAPNDQMIPKSRFDEVNNKFKEYKTNYETLLNEKNQWDTTKQELESSTQNATNELATVKTQSEQQIEKITNYETFLGELLTSKTDSLPDGVLSLMPEGDVMSKLGWIAKAEASNLINNTPVGGATNVNNNTPPLDTSNMSAVQKMAMAYESIEKK